MVENLQIWSAFRVQLETTVLKTNINNDEKEGFLRHEYRKKTFKIFILFNVFYLQLIFRTKINYIILIIIGFRNKGGI